MLDSATINKIEDFVYPQPRSVQEISIHIKKNWRTVDRYIKEIEENFGTISTRTFRGGTRGALKIVYWSSVEKVSNSIFQEKIESDLFSLKHKEDFSAFDIFQHVDLKNKKVVKVEAKDEESIELKELNEILRKCKRQLLIFSGNLSFINLKNKEINILETLSKLVKEGRVIKIICRVDLSGKENIEKMLSLNFKHSKQNIEIHHRVQPLRGFIIDNTIIRMKEIKEPTGRRNELNKKIFLFYTLNNKDWCQWLSKIFWKMFNSSIDANKRLQELNKIK